MKVSCKIVQDILPLYLEKMCSEDSAKMVEEHLEECDDCKLQLKKMETEFKLAPDTNTRPLEEIKSKLRKRKIQTIVLTVMISLVILTAGMGFLTSPKYLPYSEDIVTVEKRQDGLVTLVFDEGVSGYDIDKHNIVNDNSYSYHITAWDSLWDGLFKKPNSIVLNPNNEHVVSVYYYQTEGGPDLLLYGSNISPNGGVATLPRLVLSYYIAFAFALALGLGLLMLIFRRNKKIFNFLVKIFFIPVSYGLGHLMIKGTTSVSYIAGRDFFAIILLMIPLYFAFIIGVRLIQDRIENRDIET